MTSRVLGVFYLAGGLLVLLSLLLPHPKEADALGLFGIAGLAAVVGSASLIWAKHARMWTAHTVLATGTGLISLCVYFAGVASGIYSAMFVWVVLVAGSFFAGWAVAAHVAWAVISWGLVLAVVEEPTGFSTITRWTLGSLVLGVAAGVMSEIVAGRRATEEQLRSAQDELEALAHHDPLTEVANLRLFEIELKREMARATRQEWPLCLITLDIDDFKEYNDDHGHVAGDRLLKSAASAWAASLRAEDLIARLGGDEFVALLPNCPFNEAEQVMQRLCAATPLGRRCSAGIARWDGRESAEQLRERADLEMYEAKDRLAIPP
ncbi:MAG: GGDEF domain-containing protein [Solirubrobacterales bacterium]